MLIKLINMEETYKFCINSDLSQFLTIFMI